ncbi:transcriptional regulator [Vibrio galatheae]|uniref:Transcriptional regulator n=1 Tax=Vibrio galatheae TaxID=579748 RepID=A0A0F4NMX5_9VIBR|nr:LysR substrate-binding domain-containing protein [Vibrio galatheae]KJY84467.1 transcriptional regulator [Vibrio galatheae]
MNARLPSTKNLQAFLSTAYYLNFTHAAEALNMTQGAISRQIQSLEEIMGVALFYRQARGLSLTPEGDKFVPLAEDIVKRLQMSIREVADSANRIKLNAPSCITSWLLTRIANFQQAFPDVNVELTSTTKHEAVPNFDSFDLIITYGKPTRSKAVKQTVLFEELLAPVCAPETWQHIKAKGVNEEALLSQLTWLHANPEQSDWMLWLENSGLKKYKGKANQTFATLDQAMNAAQQGFGIAIGDITLAAQDLKLKRLLQPFEKCVSTGNGYHLLHLHQQDNLMVNRLIEWLTLDSGSHGVKT